MQARLWACGQGDVSTPSFGSHPNPISTRGGGQIMPTLYWCPHQVLKATGAPDTSKVEITTGQNWESSLRKDFNPLWLALLWQSARKSRSYRKLAKWRQVKVKSGYINLVDSRDQDGLEQRADDLANAIFNPWSILTRNFDFIKTRIQRSLNSILTNKMFT